MSSHFKRVAQPEFTFLAAATGMMFLGALAFFGVLGFMLFDDDDEPVIVSKTQFTTIITVTPPPLVFSPTIFALPPASRNEPPIESDWEMPNTETYRNSTIPQFHNSFVRSYANAKLPPPPVVSPKRKVDKVPVTKHASVDVEITFDSDGFVASVFILPGQALTPAQTRDVLNSAHSLRGEPDTTTQFNIVNDN